MEGNCNDPYEQQLLAVFESCRIEGELELDEKGLRLLCDKLQLEERGKELINCLLENSNQRKKSVSFYEFRDGLLALLGNTQEGISVYTEKDFANGDTLQGLNATRLVNKKYGRKSKPKDPDTDIADFENGHLDGARNDLWRGIDGLLNHDIKLDEQRLRDIWTKINLGSDRSEMPVVSHFIGTPILPKQTLEQIFEKLDADHDGRINLDEFLMIFRSPKVLQEQLSSSWTTNTAGSRNDIIKQDSEKDSIHIRGPHHTGYARSGTIVDMWEVAGVLEAGTLLSELGFTGAELSLTELTNVLCEELKGLRDESDNRVMGTHISLLKAALVLYQEEVRSLNTLIEHLSGERDKLRGDIAEANERASLLAQEVDENHIRLEKSSQNQMKQLELKNTEIVKDLTNQLSSERESNAAALKLMDQRLQTLQQEDQRIRNELGNLLSENRTLETENQNLSEHVSKLRLSNNQLQIQIQTLAAEHDEVENVEAKENEVLVSLLDRIKRLQSDIATLRDQNDELTSELEVLKNRDNDAKICGDVVAANDSETLIARIAELEELLRSKSSNEGVKVPSKDTSAKDATIDNHESNISELRNVIVRLKKELTNLITEKKNDCTLDNCVMKNKILEIICGDDMNSSLLTANLSNNNKESTDSVKSLANELEAEIDQQITSSSSNSSNESRRDFVTNKSDNKMKIIVDKKTTTTTNGGDDNTIVQNIDKNYNNLDVKCLSKNKMTSLRDYPPRTKDENNINDNNLMKIDKDKNNVFYNVRQQQQSASDKSTINKCGGNGNGNGGGTKDCKFQLDKIGEILKEVEEKHYNEKKQLNDRCSELERSLDLLRAEYEQCEDYWAGKLDEERQLYEQEQRISDDKFSELIAKMAEYEEQFGNCDNKAQNDGRLSPIEERFNLEQQYTNLEEEFEVFKSRCENDLLKKDKEIKELRDILLSKKKLEQRRNDDSNNKKQIKNLDFSSQFPDDNYEISSSSSSLFNSSVALKLINSSSPSPSPSSSLTTSSPSILPEKFMYISGPILQNFSNNIAANNTNTTAVNNYCESDQRIFNDTLKFGGEIENINSEQLTVSAARTSKISVTGAAGGGGGACLNGCFNCCNNQLQQQQQSSSSYTIGEELCRVHREELRRLHQLKLNTDADCNNLMKQKEILMQDILKLQSLRAINCSCSGQIDAGEQACRIDLNVLQALNTRLQSQEQKCRHLQITLKQQQQYTDRILHQTWKQHRNEITDLQFVLKGTQDKLQQHLIVYKEQAERLARADMLAKDLYLENAYLMASVERLKQHCHVLTQYSTETTSV